MRNNTCIHLKALGKYAQNPLYSGENTESTDISSTYICFSFPVTLLFVIQRFKFQELDKTSSEINRHKVRITSCEKLLKRLAKATEESIKEKEKLLSEKEKMMLIFKEIEKKAFVVQEEYKKTQEVFCSIALPSRLDLSYLQISELGLIFFFNL